MSSFLENLIEISELAMLEEMAAHSPDTLRHAEESLCRMVVLIRGQRNARTSINRLPPELLAAIFEYVRVSWCPQASRRRAPRRLEPCTHDKEPTIRVPDYRSLIFATHVCRRWRAVALEFPRLWTDIVSHSPAALVFAQRAQAAPLTVYTQVFAGRLRKGVGKVLWRLGPRVRALVLRLEVPDQIGIFAKSLSRLAPRLESLTIVVNGTRKHLFAPEDNEAWTPLLFSGKDNVLKNLVVISAWPVIPTDHFPQLASCRMYFSRFCHFSISQLVDFLSHTTNLERLSLHTGNGYIYVPDKLSTVVLPHLRDISISTHHLAYGEMLFTHLLSAMRLSGTPGADYESILDTESIVLVRHHGRMAVLARSRGAHQLQVSLSAEASFGYYTPYQGPERNSLVARAQVLYFSHPADRKRECGFLGQLCNMSPTLRTIVISDGSTHPLASFVDVPCARCFGTLGQVVLRPSLRTLIYAAERGLGQPWAVVSTSLLNAAARRAELGYPLDRLVICESFDVLAACTTEIHHVEWALSRIVED